MKLPAELPRADSRIGFLYADRCVVSRLDGAIVFRSVRGVVEVPAATVSCILLGPGTSVTHRGMSLLAEAGVSAVWVGDSGGVWYASGKPVASGSRLLLRQARIVADPVQRLAAAKRMYRRRFNDEDVSTMSTVRDLTLAEGRRMKDVYREHARRAGITWSGRTARNPRDPLNKSLTLANSCLYALCTAVINALGCSPGLGIVHTGNWRSFVLDVADMYKTDITIPLAFDIAASDDPDSDIPSKIRKAFRDSAFTEDVISTMVSDIAMILDDQPGPEASLADINELWDGT